MLERITSVLKNLSRRTKRCLMLAGAIVMLAVIVLLAAAAFRLRGIREEADRYTDRFFEGTVINGIDVSGRTAEEAEEAILAAMKPYALDVIFREDRKESIRGEEIGFHYTPGDEVERLLSEQDTEELYHRLRKGEDAAVPQTMTVTFPAAYDEQKLVYAVHSLPELQVASMKAAQNPRLTYQNAEYVVIAETEGTMLYPDRVTEAVLQAVAAGSETLDLRTVKGIYEGEGTQAAGLRKELQERADLLNELVPGSITYTLPHGETKVLDGPVMQTWLEKDAEGVPYRDEYVWETHLQEYVEDLASSVDTVGMTRTFPATGLGDIKVSGGNYGYEVNQEEELEKLREELAAGAVVTREPVWASWETSEENNGFGSSYVEIDCSRQYMWIYVDGKVVLETDVVTGAPEGKTATPAGTCLLMGKERDTELVGEYYEYRVGVSYWMPFNGGVGMHDAWWRGAFGGDIWLWDGSNGCVNMPTEMAAEAFDIVTYEMPIVVYYSEGYEGP